MKDLVKLPPYINQISDYAYLNLRANNVDVNKIKTATLTVAMHGNNPVFTERVQMEHSRLHLDCWDIFPLAKRMKDDAARNFEKIQVRIDFADGKVKAMKFYAKPIENE